MDSLRTRLDKLKKLPAHPGVLVELSVVLGDADSDSEAIERIVSQDTALAVTILREANTTAFGAASSTSSLQDAATRLGKRNLLRIAAAHRSNGPLDDAGRSYGLEPGEGWRAASAGAVMASLIAERCGLVDSRVAFNAALLRDCGKLAVDYLLDPGELEALLLKRTNGTSVLEMEREAFGFDHADVGAELAVRWGLADEVVEAIRYHHTPSECDSALADVVHCADALCGMLGLGVGLDGLAYSLDVGARKRVGLDLEGLQAYLVELVTHLSVLDDKSAVGDDCYDES